jgi:putative Mg2+ transporter-C (MgtC) family protein
MNFHLTADHIEMVWRLLAALCAGALIGYERSYNGRPAGFRTHALVCMSSSLLMLVTVYEASWVQTTAESVRLDPTRMAQGIMTGIGFLGAGAIIKEGLTVRGLTTAARQRGADDERAVGLSLDRVGNADAGLLPVRRAPGARRWPR